MPGNGVVEQTRRHSFIADLLGIKHIAVCINKMDLVGYEEEAYEKVLISLVSLPADLRMFRTHLHSTEVP